MRKALKHSFWVLGGTGAGIALLAYISLIERVADITHRGDDAGYYGALFGTAILHVVLGGAGYGIYRLVRMVIRKVRR